MFVTAKWKKFVRSAPGPAVQLNGTPFFKLMTTGITGGAFEIQFLGQHAVIHRSAAAVDDSKIPAAGRQRHRQGIGQHVNVLFRGSRIETSISTTRKRRQRRPLADHQVGIVAQFQELEGRFIGIGTNVKLKITGGTVFIGQRVRKRPAIRQVLDVIIHFQHHRGRVRAVVANAEIVSLSGQQRGRSVGNQNRQSNAAGFVRTTS